MSVVSQVVSQIPIPLPFSPVSGLSARSGPSYFGGAACSPAHLSDNPSRFSPCCIHHPRPLPVSHSLLYLVSSLDRFSKASEMAAVACELARQDWQVVVAASLGPDGPLAEPLRAAGVDCHFLRRRWPVDPIAFGRLRKLLRQPGLAVVHAWDEAASYYAAGLYAAGAFPKGPRLVVQAPLKPAAPTAWQSFAGRQVVRQADQLIAESELRLPKNTNAAKWQVIPPGVAEPVSLETTRQQLLHDLQLPTEAKLVAVACPLHPRFGVKELIWAADMLALLHPNFHLLILGDGPERPHLERFARAAAGPTSIHFLGNHFDPACLLPHLDVYWQGNQPEVESPTLLQAMAAGVPVIATDTPTHREIITDGQTGYLVDYDGRASRTYLSNQLFGDAVLAEQIGNAGRKRAQDQFNLLKQTACLIQLYDQLLSSC